MFKYCYIVIVDCCCYIYNVDIYFFLLFVNDHIDMKTKAGIWIK